MINESISQKKWDYLVLHIFWYRIQPRYFGSLIKREINDDEGITARFGYFSIVFPMDGRFDWRVSEKGVQLLYMMSLMEKSHKHILLQGFWVGA